MARYMAIILAAVLMLAFVPYAAADQCYKGMAGGPGEKCIKMMIGGGGDCCGMMHGRGHMKHGFFVGKKEELGLTDAQVEKLKSMKLERGKRAIKEKANLKTLELELRDLMSKDEIDVKAVDRKIDQIASQRAKIHKAQVHAMLDAKKVLTPEQKKKLKESKGHSMKKSIKREIKIER